MAGFASSSLIELFKSDAPLLRDVVSAVERVLFGDEVDPEAERGAHWRAAWPRRSPSSRRCSARTRRPRPRSGRQHPADGRGRERLPRGRREALPARTPPARARRRAGAPPPKPPSRRAPEGDRRHTLHSAACNGSAETVAALIAAWPGATGGSTPRATRRPFAAACQAPVAVVAGSSTNPAAAAMRGRFNRLPLALALLCGAARRSTPSWRRSARPCADRISADSEHGRGVALPLERPPSEKARWRECRRSRISPMIDGEHRQASPPPPQTRRRARITRRDGV